MFRIEFRARPQNGGKSLTSPVRGIRRRRSAASPSATALPTRPAAPISHNPMRSDFFRKQASPKTSRS